MRPQPGDYNPYFDTYISLVKGDDIVSALEKNYATTISFLKSIPVEKGDYSYAPGKWSVKQVIIHISDTERVFTYRALSIARGDTAALPGYDENIWAANSAPEKRTIADVTEEFSLLRQNTIHLFKTFGEEQFLRKGIANSKPASVIALAFVIAGHELHHLNVLKERYGLQNI